MSDHRFQRVIIAAAIASAAVTGPIACSSPEQQAAAAATAAFDALVTRGDAAAKIGDADGALTLYADAVAIKGGAARADELTKRMDAVKPLALSRRILASTTPSVDTISSYVQVLQYSAGATETAAAAAGLADCLNTLALPLSREIVQLKKEIAADKVAEMPLTVSLVLSLGDGIGGRVTPAPEPYRTIAAKAVADMLAAAEAVDAAFGRTYADAALRDLAKARRSSAAATAGLAALRAAK